MVQIESLKLDGNQYYCLTMYFRLPSDLCTSSSSQTNPTGDGLWIKVGNGYQTLVTNLAEANLPAGWVKGQCFWSMGVHYWWNLTASTPCNALFPVFLLYNDGMLNAWGWVFDSLPEESGGSRFEHPTPADTSSFLPTDPAYIPTCIASGPILSTMHIAHNNPLLYNYC